MGGVLPAYAGMIPPSRRAPMATVGAPRVCGDDPGSASGPRLHRPVLPAYAGMIRRSKAINWPTISAPRVCGDDPEGDYATTGTTSCSPRMRG